jgi:Fungal chitosanase of glycosyl hydrolase group 75
LKAVIVGSLAASLAASAGAQQNDCSGSAVAVGRQSVIALDGGGAAIRAKMNVNIDGSGRAYAKTNAEAGALIHLCNAGEVFLPDGTSYQGSKDNATCTGTFMDDYKRIGEAGWRDPAVGAIRWFGILGRGSATIGGRTIRGVEPVELADSPGFYVSPTSLVDSGFAEDDQRRYVDPLVVPGGVMPNAEALKALGVRLGTFGVAVDTRRADANPVPFIVNDFGPRIGEGTVALARLVAGKQIKPDITRSERFVGVVDTEAVAWVFFGGNALTPPFGVDRVSTEANAGFEAWGGAERLETCVAATAELD